MSAQKSDAWSLLPPGKSWKVNPIQKEECMKTSTRDEAEVNMHQMTGKFEEIIWQVGITIGLEAKGKNEKLDGKVPERLG